MNISQAVIFLTAFLTVSFWSPSTSQARHEPCWRPPYQFSSERDYKAWQRDCERARKAAEKAHSSAREHWKRDSERAQEAQKREQEQWKREDERDREQWKREQEQWKREAERHN